MLDCLISNGTIVDGSGRPHFRGDIGILNGRISIIHRAHPDHEGLPQHWAREVIDADGHVVCPGFIDPHSHSDWEILIHPEASSSLLMGVTTEITGNCGNSLAPTSSVMRQQVSIPGLPTELYPQTLEDYLSHLERLPLGNNQGTYVGQGAIRAQVMGTDPRFPKAEELRRMQDWVQQSLEMGAYGLSTGRAYPPGCFASFYEIAALTEIVGAHRGLYTTHIADQWAQVHRATAEAIEIGRRTGASVQIAHQKVVGKAHWGRSDELLAMLEMAQDRGIDATADVYPYPYSALLPLTDALPDDWRGTSPTETRKRLQRSEAGSALEQYIATGSTYLNARLSSYGIVYAPHTPELEGHDLGELMVQRQVSIGDLIIDLLTQNEGQVAIAGLMDENDVRGILSHPLVMIGSDSSLRGPVRTHEPHAALRIHPREYGTYPRVLGTYVREEGVLTLEEAIYKMTGFPAERLDLPDRGLISQGFWADLVIFDPDTIQDRATPANPKALPEGISCVFVNGAIAVRGHHVTEERAGRALRDGQGRVLYGA